MLATTRNRAAVSVLARALQTANATERALAISCLVRRPDADSHRVVIREYGRLCSEDQHRVRSAHLGMQHRLKATLNDALIHGEPALCENACQIIVLCRDFELFPALVQAAETRHDSCSNAISAALRQVADKLHEELANRPTGAEYPGRDPAFARRHALVALERSLTHFASHRCRVLVEVFLLLAPPGDPTLAKMLHDPRHPCHATFCELLSTSTAPGLMEQLVELLRDTDAPEPVLEAIARRTDRPFVESLLRQMKHPVALRALHNMKRLRTVAWLESHRGMLLEVDGRAQAIAVELAIASHISPESLFGLLTLLMKNGLAEGRRASCAALNRFNTREADQLVREALGDPDSSVQAAAVRQLRKRGFPDALQLLVECLDANSVEVRDTARDCLAEFNYVRFRGMFNLLDEAAVHSTGRLVRRVDDSAVQGLLDDLASPSVSARLRAIELAVAMDAAEVVSDQLIALVGAENLELRQSAIAALGFCTGPRVIQTLELAARDSHEIVRDAAARSLDQLHTATGSMPHAQIAGEAR